MQTGRQVLKLETLHPEPRKQILIRIKFRCYKSTPDLTLNGNWYMITIKKCYLVFHFLFNWFTSTAETKQKLWLVTTYKSRLCAYKNRKLEKVNLKKSLFAFFHVQANSDKIHANIFAIRINQYCLILYFLVSKQFFLIKTTESKTKQN